MDVLEAPITRDTVIIIKIRKNNLLRSLILSLRKRFFKIFGLTSLKPSNNLI